MCLTMVYRHFNAASDRHYNAAAMDEQPPVEPLPASPPPPPSPPPSPLAPRSILSPAEILVQLAIVVVGILIALSFEGVLQWSRDRALLREARQNIQNEIRNNQKDIQLVLKGVAPVRAKFFRAMELLNDLSAPEKHKEAVTIFDPNNSAALANGLTFAWLNTASYTTAQVSGAMGLMDYSDVRQLAEIYDPQELFIS